MSKQLQKIEISIRTIWYTVFILAGAWFLFAIRDILLLLFLAIVVSSAVQPIVDKFEKKKVPRSLSTLIIYVLTATFFFLIIKFIIPMLSDEFKEMSVALSVYFGNVNEAFRGFIETLSAWNIEERVGDLKGGTSNGITQLGFNLFNNTVGAFAGLFKTMIVLSLSFYMVVKEDGAWGFVKSLVPKKYENYAIGLIKRIQHQVGRWMISQFVLVVVIFALEYIALLALNVPMALTLALLGGLLEIIPYIGPIISVIPAFLIALTISPVTAVMVLLVYILIQQLENHIILPLLMKKAVGLNPVVIILVLLIGGKLAGVAGLILAVPFTAAISVVWDDLVNKGQSKYENIT